MVLIFLSLVGLLTSSISFAAPYGAWEPHCYQDEQAKGKVCTTELRARGPNQDFIFYFARGPRGPVPLVAQGMVGGLARMTVTVDDKDTIEAEECDLELCYFNEKLSSRLIKQFKKGAEAKIVILGDRGEVLFDDTITLLGFTAAYGRYR